MRVPLQALAWHFWGRHFWGIAAVSAYACLLTLFLLIFPPDAAAAERRAIESVTWSLPLVCGLAYLAAVFSFGFESRLEAAESGFPSWMYTLPVQTTTLVGWAMLQGMAVVAGFSALWVFGVLRPYGWSPPLWLPLYLATIVAVLQALVWSPFPLAWARVIVAIGVLTGLVLLAPWRGPDHGLSTAAFLGILPAIMASAFLAAMAGVSRSRHGAAGAWSWRIHAASPPVSTARPFRTAERAQLWFQWRQNGVTFPIVAGCFAVLALMWLLSVERAAMPRQWFTLILFPMLCFAFWSSPLAGLPTHPRDPFLLSAFLSTRPVSTAGIVGSMFKVSALSAVAGWLLLLPVIVVAFIKTGMPEVLAAWWENQLAEGTWLQALALFALAVFAPLLLTLNAMVGTLCIGLTGRRWVIYGSYLLGWILLVLSLMSLAIFVEHPERQADLAANLPWILGCGVALKLAIASVAALALWRRQLLAKGTLFRLLAAWLVVVSVLAALVASIMPQGVPLEWCILGVILLVPLARLTLAPLALAWNRHR